MAAAIEQVETHLPPVLSIEYLYGLSVDLYLVTFQNDYKVVYERDQRGQIRRAAAWSYYAADGFADMHPSAMESEGDNG